METGLDAYLSMATGLKRWGPKKASLPPAVCTF